MKWLAPIRRFGHAVQTVLTASLLVIVYFGVLTPLAVLRRCLGHDPLDKDDREPPHWQAIDLRSTDHDTTSMY